jgi:hypothetical protein
MRPTPEAPPITLAVRLATAVAASTDLVHQLHELHAQQWMLEDATRYRDASADQIATAKTAIDACNSRRHQLIDAIDATVMYVPSADATRCYSETIGELCDRLLIFDLKLAALRAAECHAAAPDGRVDDVLHVCGHLSAVVDQLTEDMAMGRALMPPRVGIKIYARELPAGPILRRNAVNNPRIRVDGKV